MKFPDSATLPKEVAGLEAEHEADIKATQDWYKEEIAKVDWRDDGARVAVY